MGVPQKKNCYENSGKTLKKTSTVEDITFIDIALYRGYFVENFRKSFLSEHLWTGSFCLCYSVVVLLYTLGMRLP